MIFFVDFREKKVIDLDKPLLTGAFVDPTKITQYTEKDYILPEIPPFSWMIKNAKVNWRKIIFGNRELWTFFSKNTISNYNQPKIKSDEVNENKATNGNHDELSASPDQRNNLINNNINNNNNNNSESARKCANHNDNCLHKEDKDRFGSTRTLSREDDRILKEMVSAWL